MRERGGVRERDSDKKRWRERERKIKRVHNTALRLLKHFPCHPFHAEP